MAMMASGPWAEYSSRPTLATPNQGRSSLANRAAATRSSTSSAIAKRSRASMDDSDQVGDTGDVVVTAPTVDLVIDAGRGAGFGEHGGADLHGVGPRHQQLDGVGAGGDTAHSDDGGIGEGGAAVEYGADRDGMDGRAGKAAATAAGPQPVGPRAGVDGHAHDGVDQRDRVGAGVEGGARDLGEIGDVRAELGPHWT